MPFWMLFGLTGALAGSALLDAAIVSPQPATVSTPGASWAPLSGVSAAGRARGVGGLVGAVLVGGGIAASTLVSVARGPVGPLESPAVDGLYRWETNEEGTPFRWTGQYASVFVPADVTRVYIPLRLPTRLPAISPMGVEIVGADRHTEAVVSNWWIILNLELPDAIPPVRFKRIDVRVDRTWQPALYLPGSSDFRSVGVQVGECRLFRER
jgi:hypothetical protein